MLFNSPEFLFAFLPATLTLTYLMVRFFGRAAGIGVLTIASLVFYGWWSASDLLVIAGSVAFNYAVATRLARRLVGASDRQQRILLGVGVAANLAVLGYFKYSGFAVQTLAPIVGADSSGWTDIALPLAISFYTFQQIAFLVDTYHRKMESVPFRQYLISVVFFPHLIAGPLLHYRDIIGQMATRFGVSGATIAAGLPVFAMGLAKKVFIADPIAQYVSPMYASAADGPLGFMDAWAASLGYTAQLYFDFSGYSDMAIGLGLMFGIALPINFASPYKSRSIIDFWRRWHITLSNFLRDYLYFSLGGSRKGEARKYVNLLLVMLLGGLWHGAGWTFVFWGALHGTFLVINHLWAAHFSPRLSGLGRTVEGAASPVLTFLLVVVAWVFFRSESFEAASNVLTGMVALPSSASHLGYASNTALWLYLAAAYAIAFLAPNTQEIFGAPSERASGRVFSPRVAVATGALLWVSFFGLFSAVPSEFLYFQF